MVAEQGEAGKEQGHTDLESPEQSDFERAARRRGVRVPRAVVSVAFRREDFELVAAAAERANMKLSEFIRAAALAAARGGRSEPGRLVIDGASGAAVFYADRAPAYTELGSAVRLLAETNTAR